MISYWLHSCDGILGDGDLGNGVLEKFPCFKNLMRPDKNSTAHFDDRGRTNPLSQAQPDMIRPDFRPMRNRPSRRPLAFHGVSGEVATGSREDPTDNGQK
jgi:hypothetical protein